jgi:hypothetical protein
MFAGDRSFISVDRQLRGRSNAVMDMPDLFISRGGFRVQLDCPLKCSFGFGIPFYVKIREPQGLKSSRVIGPLTRGPFSIRKR